MFQNNNENKFSKNNLVKPFETNTNCLCDHCNYHQQLKIEKLAEFKPKGEVIKASFFRELNSI